MVRICIYHLEEDIESHEQEEPHETKSDVLARRGMDCKTILCKKGDHIQAWNTAAIGSRYMYADVP